MTKEEFQNIGKEWKRLNAEYDSYVEAFIDDMKKDDIEKLKQMQQDLFNLEVQLFAIMNGEVIIN